MHYCLVLEQKVIYFCPFMKSLVLRLRQDNVEQRGNETDAGRMKKCNFEEQHIKAN